MVLVLAATMVLGTFYYVFVFAVAGSRADAVSKASTDDLKVRVALIYSSSVTVDFKTVTDYGFILGFNDSENNFTELSDTDVKTLNIACDGNLTRSDDRYAFASSASKTTVGGYHLGIKCDTEEIYQKLSLVSEKLSKHNVFSGYYNGVRYIMIGQYTSEASAKTDIESIKAALAPEQPKPEETTAPETSPPETTASEADTTVPETSSDTTDTVSAPTESGETVTTEAETETEPQPPTVMTPFDKAVSEISVISPSKTALKAIDPETENIVFAFDDSSSKTSLGVMAKQTGEDYSYIKGYKGTTKYTYDGVLECAPIENEDTYGVRVINVLSIETYICGVMPYEISNTWPLETQKAFAIAVRSFTIANLGRHKSSYNADLCCTANCQVYKGFGSTNARVRQAADETRGIIAIYKDRICSTFYSSSTGGCTANVSEVWGSSQSYYGYLKAVPTPWEKYESYGNGSWTSSATGKQLYDRLVSKGYKGLKGNVTKVEITQLGKNSSYVYSITFYDTAGNSVKVSQINKVKSLLSPYVKSGNFVVAKAGEKVTRNNYTMLGFGAVNTEESEGVFVKTNPFDYTVYGRQSFSVLTADGLKAFADGTDEKVMTANGVLGFNMSKALDSQYYPTMTGVNGKVLPDIKQLGSILETETLTAEGPSGSFVFIGRGWGHGVGLSQWGIKDLGDLGYDFETIIRAYYSDIELVNYTDFMNSK